MLKILENMQFIKQKKTIYYTAFFIEYYISNALLRSSILEYLGEVGSFIIFSPSLIASIVLAFGIFLQVFF